MARTPIEVYLHIVFSTKNRANITHPEIEAEPHRYIAGVIANLDSRCIAVNGTGNHVHTLVSLGKTMAIGNLGREVKKGPTSWLKRQEAVSMDFNWQDGYGGFSMGRSELPAVRRYVAAQKEHHRRVSYDEEWSHHSTSTVSPRRTLCLGLKMRPLRGRRVTAGGSAGHARARCTRPRATHGYSIDRSAVAERTAPSSRKGQPAVAGSTAPRSRDLPLRGRGVDCSAAAGLTAPRSRKGPPAVAGSTAPRSRN